jgi:hypothetical protein
MRFFTALMSALCLAVLFFAAPSVMALSAYLNPEAVVIELQPGQSFSFEVFVVSEEGDAYDMSLQGFDIDKDKVERIYRPLKNPDLFWVDDDVLDFDGITEQKVLIQGEIPEDLPPQDIFLALFLDRETQGAERVTVRLKSHLYLRIGDLGDVDAEMQDAELFLTETGEIDYAAFTLLPADSLERFFSVTGVLQYLNDRDEIVHEISSLPQRVFPGLEKKISIQLFADEDIELGDDIISARFLARDEGGQILDDETLSELPEASSHLAKQRKGNIYGEQIQLKISNTFVWTEWLGHFLLIILGLSLIAYTLYPRKD